MRFAGTERVTIELDGTFDPAHLALPDGLTHEGRVSLFAFHVVDLRVVGMPLVRSTYAEVLWRIAVRHHDRPAWWVVACDLADRIPSIAARRWVRYPVRKNALDVTDTHVRIADSFAFELAHTNDPATVEQRTLLTGNLYEVPWGDDANGARSAHVRHLTDTLGRVTVGSDITWSEAAIVRHGRIHQCGVALRR